MPDTEVVKEQHLLCSWSFSGDKPLLSTGKYAYQLTEGNCAVQLSHDPALTGTAAFIKEGTYYYIPRADCPGLNIKGKNAQVTILAWVKRWQKSHVQCEAIAGMWNETEKKRQYCLFLNLRLFDSADQVCGHISGVGGPTPGQKWCIDASIGKTPVNYSEWTFVGFTYDGASISSYLNGSLDSREKHNPYLYTEGIFDGGANGSDFTVGAVHRLEEMGNYFVGHIALLSVYDKALTEDEINHVMGESRAQIFQSK